MKKKSIVGGLFVAMLAVTTVSNAQTRTPLINHREKNQKARINQGVRSGELTHHEAHTLRNNERNINAEKRIARANGKVGPRERSMIRHQESRDSRTIYNKKHNAAVN